MKVLITGSLGYDYIMSFPGRFADRIMPDRLHQISLSFFADTLTKNLGGTAGNLAYTVKLLGGEPYIVAAAGNDFSEYKTFLERHQIATEGILIVAHEPTGSYHVVTDRDDNQIGAFYAGATTYNKELSLQGESLKTFVVIGPNDPEAMRKFVRECRENKLRYMYDPAFQIDAMTPDDLRAAVEASELVIGNDYEIALMEEKLEVSHEELILMGPKAVITTLGAKGSIIETRFDAIAIKPATPKSVKDPTGAGDAYRAGFLVGYCRGFDWETCGRMGSVAAAYTVERFGTITHHFTVEAFAKRYKENYTAEIRL